MLLKVILKNNNRLLLSLSKQKLFPRKYLSSISTTTTTTPTRSEKIEQVLSEKIESINKITGLSAGKLNELKNSVQETEISFNESKKQLIECRRLYEDAVKERSQVQGEINVLLQRKSEWSENDVERFSEIYKKEHSLKELEKKAKQNCINQESVVDSQQTSFLQSLRLVYSEENMLANKARVVNTYVTWGLIALNSSIFLISTLMIEPNKRKKFEERVQKVVEIENNKTTNEILKTLRNGENNNNNNNMKNNNNNKNQEKNQVFEIVGGTKKNVTNVEMGKKSTIDYKNETNNEIIENIKDDKEIIDDGIFITTDQVGAFCLGAISAIIISALMGGG